MADDKRSTYRALYEAATLGFVFPIATGVGYLLGRWLDGTFGTYPWLTIIFSALGIAAGFVNLFRAAARANGNSGRKGP
ncbi:MAG TPA: AtpZ/AtpI family protein [Thermoanaerobaculia bacterium]|nr:AtpZ/AtpI family protein [Thermoanaerobaculia bacterium]